MITMAVGSAPARYRPAPVWRRCWAWAGHEQQWRGGDPLSYAQIDPRKADIATIYNSGDLDQSRELLRKYGVDYIYVGVAEPATYDQLDLNKLAQLGEQVFQQGNVTIYRVKP